MSKDFKTEEEAATFLHENASVVSGPLAIKPHTAIFRPRKAIAVEDVNAALTKLGVPTELDLAGNSVTTSGEAAPGESAIARLSRYEIKPRGSIANRRSSVTRDDASHQRGQ